jgi:hypothetical protein
MKCPKCNAPLFYVQRVIEDLGVVEVENGQAVPGDLVNSYVDEDFTPFLECDTSGKSHNAVSHRFTVRFETIP